MPAQPGTSYRLPHDLHSFLERITHSLVDIIFFKHVITKLGIPEARVKAVKALPITQIANMHVISNLEVILLGKFPTRRRLSLNSLPNRLKGVMGGH